MTKLQDFHLYRAEWRLFEGKRAKVDRRRKPIFSILNRKIYRRRVARMKYTTLGRPIFYAALFSRNKSHNVQRWFQSEQWQFLTRRGIGLVKFIRWNLFYEPIYILRLCVMNTRKIDYLWFRYQTDIMF